MQNRLFNQRVKAAQTRTLLRLAKINEYTSKKLVEPIKFKGFLFSSINLKSMGALKVHVICLAPYGYEIETGEPSEGKGNYVYFNEAPLLEEWVRTKLMLKAPEKAKYFLNVKHGVKVGAKGFPYKYPKGVRFMEQGAGIAAGNVDMVLTQELNKLK